MYLCLIFLISVNFLSNVYRIYSVKMLSSLSHLHKKNQWEAPDDKL